VETTSWVLIRRYQREAMAALERLPLPPARKEAVWTLLIACGGGVLLALVLTVAVGTPGNLGVTVARGTAQQPQVTGVVPDSAAWMAGVRPGA